MMQYQTTGTVHGHACHVGLFARNLFVGQRIPLAGVAHQNGAGFFSSSGAVNPASITMAIALRVGAIYEQDWARAVQSAGIELLEYLTPCDGRSMPADVRANDLLHWQTTLLTRAVTRLAHHLWTEEFHVVSPAVIALTGGQPGFTARLLVRDPDG